MAYSKRTPSIRIAISIEEFNSLVNLLNSYTDSDLESVRNYSSKLKEKILRYTVPNISEEKTELDIRFFPSEAAEIIYLFVKHNNKTSVTDNNYYEVLLKKREEIKRKSFEN